MIVHVRYIELFSTKTCKNPLAKSNVVNLCLKCVKSVCMYVLNVMSKYFVIV